MGTLERDGIALYRDQVDRMIDRLERERPLAEQVPMVAAAAPAPGVLRLLDDQLATHRRRVLAQARQLRALLQAERPPSLRVAQPRFVALRIRHATYLRHYDYFFDALSQRSNTEHGVQLAKLERIAERAMRVPGLPGRRPRVLCFLDYPISAAIRRRHVRIAGSVGAPVAFVRLPRERAFALPEVLGSLCHEVGHQVNALLGAVPRVQAALRARAGSLPHAQAGALCRYLPWVSELLSDLFAVVRLGAPAVRSAMMVFQLPASILADAGRADAPHPPPAVRLRFQLAALRTLAPCRSRRRLERLVAAMFPLRAASRDARAAVVSMVPCVVQLMLDQVGREFGVRHPSPRIAHRAA